MEEHSLLIDEITVSAPDPGTGDTADAEQKPAVRCGRAERQPDIASFPEQFPAPISEGGCNTAFPLTPLLRPYDSLGVAPELAYSAVLENKTQSHATR